MHQSGNYKFGKFYFKRSKAHLDQPQFFPRDLKQGPENGKAMKCRNRDWNLGPVSKIRNASYHNAYWEILPSL